MQTFQSNIINVKVNCTADDFAVEMYNKRIYYRNVF